MIFTGFFREVKDFEKKKKEPENVLSQFRQVNH